MKKTIKDAVTEVVVNTLEEVSNEYLTEVPVTVKASAYFNEHVAIKELLSDASVYLSEESMYSILEMIQDAVEQVQIEKFTMESSKYKEGTVESEEVDEELSKLMEDGCVISVAGNLSEHDLQVLDMINRLDIEGLLKLN